MRYVSPMTLIAVFLSLLFICSNAWCNFAVVYSVNTGRIRSIVVPDSDEQLNAMVRRVGEEILILDDSKKQVLPVLQNIVSQQTGLIPQNDRFAVVSPTGSVKGVIIADPGIDFIPGFQLIPSTWAGPGFTWNPQTGFTPPVAVVVVGVPE